MGVETERQVVIICDSCWANCVEAGVRQKDLVKRCRKVGWSFSKGKAICPDCKKLMEGQQNADR